MKAILHVTPLLVPLLCGSALAASGKARSAAPPDEVEFTRCQKYPAGKRFKLELHGEVGVAELVAVVGDIGCQPILVASSVAQRGGKVALDVPDEVTAPEVFRLFHAALETLGLTIERSGKLWKIVDAARAREVSTLSTGSDGDVAPQDAAAAAGEQFVTRLLRVKNGSFPEIGEVVGKMKSKDGDVSPYAPTQSLIITDHAANVRRMESLVRALDVAAPGEKIFSLATHTQSPTELAATLDKVLSSSRRNGATGGSLATPAAPSAARAPGTNPSGAGPQLVPVDSARLLLVIGDEAGYRRVAAIAARIDPLPPADGTFGSGAHVLYLAHTNATDMAATLKELGLAQHAGGGPGRGGPSSSATGAIPLQGDVRVAPDKVSNAIIVFAGSADFLTVRDLITKLDIPRRQVYVEAAILDLGSSQGRDLGLALHGGDTTEGGTSVVGASNSSSLTSVTASAASMASQFLGGGLTAGVFGKSFDWNGITVPSFGVMLKALESSKDVNVISQPHLLTMDNEKASLSVGQSIPFQTQSLGSTASTGSTTLPTVLNSYQRQDVALKLELTPHLNDSESIRLEIDGEISDVPDGQSSTQAGGPTTNKRTIKTAIVINDGETVVLGGLQKETESEKVERVPGLGEIPILGRLFQYRSRSRSKQDLMIAITPWVIRGPADLRRIFERKQQDQKEFAMRFDSRPDFSAPSERAGALGRGRGLLVEIDRTARQAEHDVAVIRQAELADRRTPVEGEIR